MAAGIGCRTGQRSVIVSSRSPPRPRTRAMGSVTLRLPARASQVTSTGSGSSKGSMIRCSNGPSCVAPST